MTDLRALLPLTIIAALGLTGCAAEPGPAPTVTVTAEPSSDPEPAVPDLSSLALTPDGLTVDGELRVALGEPVAESDPASAVLVYDPAACTELGYVEGEPFAGVWFANYADAPFYAAVADGRQASPVSYIAVESGLVTDAGLALGDTEADVVAAYPDAVRSEGTRSDTLAVEGERGALVVEISKDDGQGTWATNDVDRVVAIRAVGPDLSREPTSGTDGFAACPA